MPSLAVPQVRILVWLTLLQLDAPSNGDKPSPVELGRGTSNGIFHA